nr:hypothetical protein [Tanacetum cinerariifolium]GFB76701.1 hypothetical protein [Tanacetum cinerariifolium]
MRRGGKGTGKRTRSRKRLNGDQVITDHADPTVMEEVSRPNIVPTKAVKITIPPGIVFFFARSRSSYDLTSLLVILTALVPTNGEGLNGDINMEEVPETTSNLTDSFDADKATQSLGKYIGSNLSNEVIVVALFGVPL